MQWEYSNSVGLTPTEPGFYWVQELWTKDDTTWLSPMIWELVRDDDDVLRFYDFDDDGEPIALIDHTHIEEYRAAGPIEHPDFKHTTLG